MDLQRVRIDVLWKVRDIPGDHLPMGPGRSGCITERSVLEEAVRSRDLSGPVILTNRVKSGETPDVTLNAAQNA